MSTIRPTHLPPQPQGQPAGQSAAMNDARTAAQRAFFQAALGGAARTAQTPAPAQGAAPAPTVFAQPVQRMPDPAAEQPQRILRPGSLLDIRV